MTLALIQIRHWLATFHKLLISFLSISCRQNNTEDQRVCGCLGVYISLLVACRTEYLPVLKILECRSEGTCLAFPCSMSCISVFFSNEALSVWRKQSIVSAKSLNYLEIPIGPGWSKTQLHVINPDTRNFIWWQEMVIWGFFSPIMWQFHLDNLHMW